MITTCTRCSQVITEIITIDNKPYGTTCAETILGTKLWFKSGDYNKKKAERESTLVEREAEFKVVKARTSKYWAEWLRLSKAVKTDNEWERNFITSIIEQLGYHTYISYTDYDTMEEAENNWSPAYGSFPYLYNDKVRNISDLSPKQINLLERILS